MPSLHLTKRTVDEIPLTQGGQKFYRDSALRGFGVRVGTRSKVYIVEGQAAGSTRRVTIGRTDTLAMEIARKKAIKILAEMADGVVHNAKRHELDGEWVTVRGAFERFFAAKPNLTSNTVAAYKRTAESYLLGWANKPIAEITRQMVLAQHRRLSEDRGATTANSVFRHFRSVFNFTAAAFEDFPSNPVAILTQARAWHRERRRRRVITISALPEWWSAVVNDDRDCRDIMLAALFTGMRKNEVLTLRWENIDLVASVLTVPTTKNGDPLTLPMSHFLTELLRERQASALSSPWVFQGRGKTGHITEVKSYVRRIVSVSGIEFSLHDLRRTFVTIAESLDVSAYSLKHLLNHRIGSDITAGYIVIDVERLRSPVARIADRILELAGVAKPT